MRILFIDIDTLRPDHLGCYGYHRNTSPAIDSIAEQGIRFDQCFVPDAPCLPSRAALHHGKFGIHTGAINHGGRYADPFIEGPTREFGNSESHQKMMQLFKRAGFHNGTVSSFAGRHDTWWFLAGFHEVYDCGKGGGEIATEVLPHALDFINRHQSEDNWILHFNIWDPHTSYRTPTEYGNPFENDPIAPWVTQEMIDRHNDSYGPHSANAVLHMPGSKPGPREVSRISNLDDYKKWIDGYDTGIRYADDAVKALLDTLKKYGIYDDTAVVITSDHGENQGELNVYGDHQTADLITNRVPMIVRWPGISPRVDTGFHYQFDVFATVLSHLGIKTSGQWDAVALAPTLDSPKYASRKQLFLSQAAWSCQRSVIYGDHILIKTYHGGLKEFPEIMLYNRKQDPHELHNLAEGEPALVEQGLGLLQTWIDTQLDTTPGHRDPMMKVLEEGGPYHTRVTLERYLEYYRKLGREDLAKRMAMRYG